MAVVEEPLTDIETIEEPADAKPRSQTTDARPDDHDAPDDPREPGTEAARSTTRRPPEGPIRVVLPRTARGLRIRRLRMKSVMKLASVFFVLGYLVTLGTLVVLWNVAQRLGYVTDIEDLVETSLGLDRFDVVGQELFDLAVVALGIAFAIGLVIAILLALVYNAACGLFGGLAVETEPLRRPRKVFSLRHRRFIDVR